VFGRFDPVSRLLVQHDVEPMMAREANSWLHMSYSARLVLASSIVVDTVTAGLPVNEDTVQKAIGYLLRNKVNRSGDTMTGYLTLPAANPVLADHATRKGYVDDNIHEHLRYVRSYGITGVDINWVLTSGWYDGSALGGAPDGRWWYLQVQRHSNSDNYVTQIVYDLHDAQHTYRRVRVGGGWSAWSRGYAGYADSAGSASWHGRTLHWSGQPVDNHPWLLASADNANVYVTHQSQFARASHAHGYYHNFRGGSLQIPGGNGANSSAHFHFDAFPQPPITTVTPDTTVPYGTVRMFSISEKHHHHAILVIVNRTNTTHTWFHVQAMGS
jgi:hypothetical protein